MKDLKKYFPFSFTEKKDVVAVIVNVLMHIFAGWVISIVLAIAGILPVIGWVTGIAGFAVEVYLFAGMVLSVLDYLNMLK